MLDILNVSKRGPAVQTEKADPGTFGIGSSFETDRHRLYNVQYTYKAGQRVESGLLRSMSLFEDMRLEDR